MNEEQYELPTVAKRAELLTNLREHMGICTLLRDAAGTGVVEALIAKGYGLIGDSTRDDPLGNGVPVDSFEKQSEEETVVAVSGPFYMRGDLGRTMEWAKMSGMKVLACKTSEFIEGLEASEPVSRETRAKFGEATDTREQAEKLIEVIERVTDIIANNRSRPSREDCVAADKINVLAKFPDADVEVELCMACVERYIAGDTDALDIMDEPLVRRAILAAFIAQHPHAKLPNAKVEAHMAGGKIMAPSTDTKQ